MLLQVHAIFVEKELNMGRVLLVVAALLLSSSAVLAQVAEKLDRGLVALRQADGSCYVGWRLLDSDPADVAFHVYRQTGSADTAQRLTREPVRESTNFVVAEAGKEGPQRYFVRPATAAGEGPPSVAVAPLGTPAGESSLAIRLQGNYRTHKVGVGDLDGDGQYELVIQQPDFNTDPYQAPGYWKKSPDTYKLEAYSLDGRFLWRHDMGWSIEAGTWYAPYVVYDLDGDGKAEVYCKGGEGDPREPEGHVKTGPEWLYRLDGQTGQIVKQIAWIPRLPEIGEYNYFCRNMLAVAYLDGRRPHLLMQRGTYRAIVIEAYDPDLKLVWRWNSHNEKEKYDSQGLTPFAWPTWTTMAVTRSSWGRAWWTTTARPSGRWASATPTRATWAESIPNERACRSSWASSRVRRAVRCDWSRPSRAKRSGRTRSRRCTSTVKECAPTFWPNTRARNAMPASRRGATSRGCSPRRESVSAARTSAPWLPGHCGGTQTLKKRFCSRANC